MNGEEAMYAEENSPKRADGRISTLIHSLYVQLDSVDKQLTILVDRLDRVQRPTPVDPERDSLSEVGPAQSPLADELASILRRVSSVGDRLMRVHESLDL